ncbi:DUF1800 domain-containing protein [Segetibacter aerophilus]|uniref:DUF1800 domain-containing protein n=1 Tax=Segetibacter aerophilus TaxID=670293 RepID=A0A512BAI7_9BACT|nr:DUF1800 domain-containing protein [Segetibacter aerophilus]GEO08976.1 hypothetical protein SAE01_14720 [Segetibacter aerophilus]
MNRFNKLFLTAAILILSISLFSFITNFENRAVDFPYKLAGLTERQAAAHLLSRFTFGAKPGQVDEVLAVGLEKWFNQQLSAGLADDELQKRLQGYDAMKMNNAEIVETFVRAPQVLKMATEDGVITRDSLTKKDKAAYKTTLDDYMQQKGFKPQKELFRQLSNQKILRAVYSNNQLQEVLTDFWFNHFNVSVTKRDCAEYIPVYERDAIRPNVLGKFQDLLIATAKSPAMLLYLDNFSSSSTNPGFQMQVEGRLAKKMRDRAQNKLSDTAYKQLANKVKNAKKNQGLNENYAREVMELHTLGVEGGYSQNDVTQAARVLTGWTIYPMADYARVNAMRRVIENIGESRLAERGFVHEGDFLFAANRHDDGEKVVLGKTFKGEGYREGVQLFEMLAHHPSTAKFITKKIAVRFVSDYPPQSLLDKMAKTFQDKDGDIKQVLLTMVHAPEFWASSSIREKTKSPFELAISSVRSINADIKMPYQLYTWIDKMGQKLYFYQAPTGFPDKAQYWINTGALLNRMNFGLALASQRIPGINIDLLNLNNHREPESAEAALLTYGKIIMPERDLQASLHRLSPLLNDPQLQQKIEEKAAGQSLAQLTDEDNKEEMMENNINKNSRKKQGMDKSFVSNATQKGTNNMLSQVVGIIIGSPEFQRR